MKTFFWFPEQFKKKKKRDGTVQKSPIYIYCAYLKLTGDYRFDSQVIFYIRKLYK